MMRYLLISVLLNAVYFNSYGQQVQYVDLINTTWEIKTLPNSPRGFLDFDDSLHVVLGMDGNNSGYLVYSLEQLPNATIIIIDGAKSPRVQPGKRYILAKKLNDDKLAIQYFFAKEKPIRWDPDETVDNTGAIDRINKGTVHAPK